MSSMPEGYITVDSSNLRDMAQLHFDIAERDKKSYIENSIANLMKPKKFLWFDITLTREKAIEKLRETTNFTWTLYDYNNSMGFAERIIQSTRVAKEVLISIETLNRLFSTMSDEDKAKFMAN